MKPVLTDGDVTLRLLSRLDAHAWEETRKRNYAWLTPWDATNPPESQEVPLTFGQMVRRTRSDARSLRAFAFTLLINREFAGQVTLGGITWGSLRCAHIGYWIDAAWAGRGYMPRAVALASDFAFFTLGVHRIEINIRPENRASIRVAEKLGFRYEGLRQRYLHINGAWCDHLAFALTVEEVPGGLLTRVKKQSHE